MLNDDEYPLDEDEIRRIDFRLLLTPGERLKLNDAIVREWYLKRNQARQFVGRPDRLDLRRPPGYEDLP